MKNIYISALVMTILLLLGNGNNAEAQATAVAMSGATVIVPIGIVKNVDMNFGNAAVSASVGGSLVLAPGGTRLGSSGVTLPATTGSVAAASFTVSGAPGYTYAITLPGGAVINGPGAATMSVTGFTSVPSGTGILSSGGTQNLAVGATLTVAASQAVGVYTNATAIPVTVNYN